jgi:hypothetical protein
MRLIYGFFLASTLLAGVLSGMDHSASLAAALSDWVGRTADSQETIMRARYMIQKTLLAFRKTNSPEKDYFLLSAASELLGQSCVLKDSSRNKSVFEWAQSQKLPAAAAHAQEICASLERCGLLKATDFRKQ